VLDETNTGPFTVDGKTETDVEIVKSGSGTPFVTIGKYAQNPNEEPAFPHVDKYMTPLKKGMNCGKIGHR